MAITRYLVLSTQYLALSAAVISTSIGCSFPVAPESEPSLAAQASSVRAGSVDRIQVETTPLTDDDLSVLAGLETLRELLLDNPKSNFTAAGLRHIERLPKLEHLRIRGTGIDDEALKQVTELTTLRILNLPQGSFSDAALVQLKRLPQLDLFRFGSRNVTNAGMKILRELPTLSQLHLIDVPITDDGLRELAKMDQLKSLYIDGGNISDAAWDEFFAARPKLHIHVNQQHHDRDPHGHPH